MTQSSSSSLIWALVGVFAPLSIVTIGGGQGIIAEVHRQVVDVHHWLTPAQFVNDFAISRMTPGPGSMLATLIGWQVAGFWGAVAATVALFGPTAFLIYGVARAWTRYRGARWQRALETGLAPVASGMVLAAFYVLLRSLDGGWLAIAIALTATAALMLSKLNPLLVIGVGAVVFSVVSSGWPALG